MENIFSRIIHNFYRLAFKEEPSQNIKIFIQNLRYVTIGFGFYAIFAFFSQIIAGRVLGPAEYGKYILVQSVAAFLFIPMSLSISTAMVKYNAEKEDITRQRKIISTAFIMVFIFSVISAIFFFFLSEIFSKIFGVSLDIFNLSIIYALFYGLYYLSVDTLRSLHKMKQFAIFRAFYGLLFLVLILSFVFAHQFSFHTVVFIEYVAFFFIFFAVVFSIRKYFLLDFDEFWGAKLLRYGSYAVITTAASAFYSNFNQIIVNKYLTLTDVGIFGAYFICFVTLPAYLSFVFNAVFFPAVSRSQNKKIVLSKMNKIVFFYAILSFPCLAFAGFLLLKLYGAKYNFNFELGLMLAISSLLVFINNTYSCLMNSTGERGAKITSLSAIIFALLNVILSILLIPRIGLNGVAISLIVSYIFSIFIILFNIKVVESAK